MGCDVWEPKSFPTQQDTVVEALLLRIAEALEERVEQEKERLKLLADDVKRAEHGVAQQTKLVEQMQTLARDLYPRIDRLEDWVDPDRHMRGPTETKQ